MVTHENVGESGSQRQAHAQALDLFENSIVVQKERIKNAVF